MNIILDLDGVVYRWHESLYRYFCEFKGYKGTIYDFWLRFIHEKSIDWDYYCSIPLLYLDTTPRDDVLIYLPKIAKLHTIYYVTARPAGTEPATGKFFDYYELPFKENLVFSKEKETYCRLFRADYFLDDRPENIDAVSSVTKAILFRNVHNIPVQDNYRNVGTFKEFLELIREDRRRETLRELGFERRENES
jgi:uncharacterized HAD superfamily protein